MGRLTTDSWGVSKWKGRVETLLDTGQELIGAVPDEPDRPRSVSVDVVWEGGSENFPSIDAVRAAQDTIPWNRLSSLYIAAGENPEDFNADYHRMRLMAGSMGVGVSAEGAERGHRPRPRSHR